MQARERLARLDAAAVFAQMRHGLARRQQRTDELRFRLESAWDKKCIAASQQVDQLRARLMQQDIRQRLTIYQGRLQILEGELRQGWSMLAERRRMHWGRAGDRLMALSPLAVLARGYSLVYDSSGVLVKTSKSVQAGDTLRLRFAQGQATASVIESQPERRPRRE